MECPFCRDDWPLDAWVETRQECNQGHCSDDYAMACPSCGAVVGHVWLDGQREFRMSAHYSPGGGRGSWTRAQIAAARDAG